MSSRTIKRPSRRRRRGLSLLEAILAIAILGGALAVIGELIRLGSRSAATARDLTTAQVMCEAKMAEVAAGIEPAVAVGPAPLDAEQEWNYQIETAAIDGEGLIGVQVTVTQNLAARPASYTLVRWMVDPTIDLPDPPPESTETTEASGDSSASF